MQTYQAETARRDALKLVRRGAVIASVAVFAACVDGAPSASGPDSLATIDRLIGDAACATDAQCRTIGIGAKACGGPVAYRAWSSLHTDPEALRRAVEADTQASRSEAAASGILSNCAVVPDPGAVCLPSAASSSADGTPRQCRLRKSGSGVGAPVY